MVLSRLNIPAMRGISTRNACIHSRVDCWKNFDCAKLTMDLANITGRILKFLPVTKFTMKDDAMLFQWQFWRSWRNQRKINWWSTKMKLEYENNWELDIYRVGGVRVTDLKKVRINKIDYPVHSRDVSVEYYEHWHSGRSTSKHYFVEERGFCIFMEFDLNRIIWSKPINVFKYKLAGGKKFWGSEN